jgi:hypothetical protein
MFVGPTLPEEIHLETDVMLEFTHHCTLKLFADRLPIVHRSLLETILYNRADSSTTRWENRRPVIYKYRDNPPGWMLSPAFYRVTALIEELDLPTDPDEVIFSKIWSVQEFTGTDTAKYPAYEEFSIETLGVRVTQVPEFYLVHEFPSLPNPFNLPRYWLTPSLELIQIRRIRVFNCSIARWLKPSIDSPITQNQSIPFLEERWHPTCWGRTFLDGLSGRSVAWSPKAERCFRMARRILSGDITRGRKPGTKIYPEGAEFYAIAQDSYAKLEKQLNRPVERKELAQALGLSTSSFKKYWQSTERPYPPIAPRFSEQS